jgi:hypothetical protein
MKRAKAKRLPRRSSISKASTYEGLGEFWDVHDLADHVDRTRIASFAVEPRRKRFLVTLDPTLAAKLRQAAVSQGLTTESLLDLWLKERLAGQS